MWKWMVVALLVAHGAAHVVGVIGSLLNRPLEGTSGETTIPVGVLERGFAVLWVVALVAFLAAALGLGLGAAWWRPVAAAAVLVSTVVIAVWWNDAWRGAPLNLIVLIVLVASTRIPGLTPD